MTFKHKSGLPLAFDGVQSRQDLQGVVFHGRRPYIQGRELNDLQAIMRGRQARVSRLIAQDGDRVEGAAAVVNGAAGTVTLTAGSIYVQGDVFPVAPAILANVPMVGRVQIGVRLVTTYLTAEDDPTLRGMVPGSKAENDGDAAAREVAAIHWARGDQAEEGAFFQVYLLQDGTILDQTPPPALDGMMQALALYDRPHGHYIVSGCRVSTLGVNAGARIFSIEEGEANIAGRKVVRHASLRHLEPEAWDVGAVPGETHVYPGGASHTIQLAFAPLDTVTSILLTKERTVTLTRGAIANGIDGLPEDSVTSIVRVNQGGQVFNAGADFLRTGNGVDWAPAGLEPPVGSNYSVTFRWRDSVEADSQTATSITVSGGAEDGDIIVAYTFKLPRIDILGLLPNGAPAYIKGVSARNNPVPPQAPRDLLALAEVHNTWLEAPKVIADGIVTGVRAPTYSEIRRYFNFVEEQSRILQLERLRSEVDRRDPAAKRGMFVDPFESDYYRDIGTAQNGAVGNRLLQLAIVPTLYDADLAAPVTLDWVEEVVVNQALKSFCELINPYQNFTPLPGALALDPAADFWTEPATQFLSDVTREFQRGIDWSAWAPRQTTETAVTQVGRTEETIPFLRQRRVNFEIRGFFSGEVLTELTFDGINIMPAGPAPVAGTDGRILGWFMIPPNIVAGSKVVRAVGAPQNGTRASAVFTGQGTIVTDVMRRVTTIQNWQAGRNLFGNDDDASESPTDRADPQAQLFALPETRQLLGVDFHLCRIGDRANHILVHQVPVENGYPTNQPQAEAVVSMTAAATGWTAARYSLPMTTGSDLSHAFVIKTDDGVHSISIAGLEGFDEELQTPITAHPYPVGPRFSAVNAETWTAHQKEALAFRLVAARYPVTTKTVSLGEFDLVEASDLQVRANTELPNSACTVHFEIVRSNGQVYRVLPYQVLQLTEYISETVELRAILTGTNSLSPILYNPVELVAGRIEESALYVSRTFSVAGADRALAFLRLALPAGAAATMRIKIDDGPWAALAPVATELSPDPAWVERSYRAADIDGQTMRIEVELTGGPASRPRAADLGLGVM